MQMPFSSRIRLLIAVFFTMATLLLFPYLQYGFNPDAVAYLRIASYYQKGAWGQALNGYWSPLLSWMLWPFYRVGLPWLWAFHLVNFLAGLFSLLQLGRILDRSFRDLSPFARNALLLTFAAQLLFLEYTMVTPDLLTLCLLLYLTELYLTDEILRKPLLTGLLGALLFFAKSYCFYFFIAFTGIYSIHRAWRGGLRQFPLKALLWLCLGFALPSGAWLAANHAKYDAWEVSASAAYNYNNLDADGIIRHPYNSVHKLMPLPYPGAYCLWEDPQLTYHYSTKEGLSRRHIGWYRSLIGVNAANCWSFLKQSGIGWWIFLPLGCWLLSFFRRRPLYDRTYSRLLLFTALYISGYMMILVVGRYIWLLLFVLWLLVYKAAEWLTTARVLILLLTGYCLYVILSPLSHYFYYGRAEHAAEKAIGAAIPGGSHIATWYSKDLWTPFCQYDVHDHGGIASYAGWKELEADLKTYEIHYLVLTDTAYVSQIPAETSSHLSLVRRAGNWSLYTFSW